MLLGNIERNAWSKKAPRCRSTRAFVPDSAFAKIALENVPKNISVLLDFECKTNGNLIGAIAYIAAHSSAIC